jgi:hypothetical protein
MSSILHFENKVIYNTTQNSSGLTSSNGSLIVKGGANFLKDVYIGGLLSTSSDIKLKTNIINLNNSLDKIDTIRTVKFNYIDDPDNIVHIGFIANDFLTDFPEITRQSDKGYYSMDYSKLTPILLDCIKELKTRVQILEEK